MRQKAGDAMKTVYKGFEVEVKREKCLAGYPMLYFTVMRQSDGWYMIDSFSDSEDTVREMIADLKKSVDDYLENPEDWED